MKQPYTVCGLCDAWGSGHLERSKAQHCGGPCNYVMVADDEAPMDATERVECEGGDRCTHVAVPQTGEGR